MYSPPYTEMLLHSSNAYLANVCLIRLGILDEVNNRLEKNGLDEDSTGFQKVRMIQNNSSKKKTQAMLVTRHCWE